MSEPYPGIPAGILDEDLEEYMSEKKGPFDAAIRRISVLVNDHGDGTDAWVWDTIRPVLEAAGRVDKAWIFNRVVELQKKHGSCALYSTTTVHDTVEYILRSLGMSLPDREE